MKQLIFATGNEDKFLTAEQTCERYSIKLLQKDLAISEIQSEDPELVARDKVSKAFNLIKKPVVVTDDSWAILGLNGFPGVYMHAINQWFSAKDFLNLTLTLSDRRVVMSQYLIFDDGTQQRVFVQESEGELLREVRGYSKHPSHMIIALNGDNGQSIAETLAKADKTVRKTAQIWHDFAKWHTEN